MIFLSIHLPSLDVPEAGQKICHKHLQDISQKTKTHPIIFFNQSEKKYIKSSLSTKNSLTLSLEISTTRRILNLIRNPLKPLEISVRSDARATKKIKELIQNHNENEIFIEYEQGAYVLLEKLPKKLKSTVVFHDVISQSILRKHNSTPRLSPKRLFTLIQLKLTNRWEKKLPQIIDKAIVLNEKDKSLLQEIGFSDDQIKIEYPEPSQNFKNARREINDPYTIMFWGAMNRPENEDAMIWFTSEIFPTIKKEIPQSKLIILGANPTQKIKNLASESITVTGFVEDPIPYFEKSAIAVAPLRHGAGIKLKVLETLAAKIPTIGTDVAAEGVPPNPELLQVKNSAIEFANAVLETLKAKKTPQKNQTQETSC